MLKTIESPDKPAFMENNDNESVFKVNNDDNKILVFDYDNIKFAKKSEKSKCLKLSKSQKLSK